MDTAHILSVLSLVVSLLTGAQHGTPAQQQTAISYANNAVAWATQQLQTSQSITVDVTGLTRVSIDELTRGTEFGYWNSAVGDRVVFYAKYPATEKYDVSVTFGGTTKKLVGGQADFPLVSGTTQLQLIVKKGAQYSVIEGSVTQ